MCDPEKSEHPSTAPEKQLSEPEWVSRNQQLASAWLTLFGQAIIRHDHDKLKSLFNESALIVGGEKFGPVDTLEAVTFKMEFQTTKVMAFNPSGALASVSWRASSPIHGAPEIFGYATFAFLIIEPDPKNEKRGSIQSIMAHFSRKT